jgi:peptidoglycan/LPS O-acetylase OafA/YrhL
MFSYSISNKYRKDIDGLRAIAVLAVILFHYGFLPMGYLGVDIFFVISGFLITGLIYEECKENQFSIKTFYLRRIRRIIPLVSFICIVVLFIGIATMLPDDLENLSESIIATNFFSNNILQAITVKNYWNVVNEFKPLMHTWSLGVEEQYYLVYPILFIFFSKNRLKWILPILIGFTILSLILFFFPFSSSVKFYYLPFRFFELSLGGILAILIKQKILSPPQHQHKGYILIIKSVLLVLLLGILISLLVIDIFTPDSIQLLLVVIITCLIMGLTNKNKIISLVLENKLIVFIGKISFSLYMWHQVVLAYARYFVFVDLDLTKFVILISITLILSVLSYYLIEQVFRNKTRVNNKALLFTLLPMIFISLGVSVWLYRNAGIIKDIPELDITSNNRVRGVHAKYNDRIYAYDKDFETDDSLKVLIIGNSYARDFANILIESKFSKEIEISYIFNRKDEKRAVRINRADIIFYSELELDQISKNTTGMQKIYCIGPKNFGVNNGIFYNYKGDDYFEQRTNMQKGVLELNTTLKNQWKDKYIDMIAYVVDGNNKVPVFTPDKKFISQDCFHLVKAGAKYYAVLIENDPDFILNKIFL